MTAFIRTLPLKCSTSLSHLFGPQPSHKNPQSIPRRPGRRRLAPKLTLDPNLEKSSQDRAKTTYQAPAYTVTSSADSLRPVIDPEYRGSLPFAYAIDRFLNHPLTEIVTAGLVMLSCTIFALETIEVPAFVDHALLYSEKVITLLFFVEYVARWYSKDLQLRFLVTRLMIIDVIAILPLFFYQFWSLTANAFDLQFVRLLRVARVFRLQRILDKTEFRNIFGNVSEGRLKTTEILLTVFSLVYLSAGLYFDAEHGSNPGVRNFFDALYYTVGILSTVGMGSEPVTPAGETITAVTVVVGALIVPFQLGALAKTALGDMMTTAEKDPFEMGVEKAKEDESNSKFFNDTECSRCTLRCHQIDARFCRNCGAPLPSQQKN